MDQAQSLREQMNRLNLKQQDSYPKPSSRVITITSGKGGVGKSNFTLNFALGLKAVGKKVVILDLDLAMANINILMGIVPKYTLNDVLYQKKSIWDVIEKGTYGIEYISGGFDLQDLLLLDSNTVAFFLNQLLLLQSYADFILLDTGAGISKEHIDFIMASDETIMVTTPEPTSIADSYSVLKTVLQFAPQAPNFRLVVNRAQNYNEAVETSRALKNACSGFLKIKLNTLGFLMEDQRVRDSVKKQIPFYLSYPNSEATKNIKQMVYSFLPEMGEPLLESSRGIRGFFDKLLSFGRSS